MEGKGTALDATGDQSGALTRSSKSTLQDADKLKELRYNTAKVERHLKQLVKSGEELQKARDELYVKEQQWVMDMTDFNLHHDVRSEKHPASLLAGVLKDYARQMYLLNKEVHEGVMQPMKQFLQVEVNGSVEMQKKLDMARERYQTATTKFSSVSHKTDMGHFTKWETEVAESKQEYDLIYFNGMTKMMEVERNKIHLAHSYFYQFFVAYQKFYDTTGQTFTAILWKEAIDEGRKKAREQASENDDIMLDHVAKLQQSTYKSAETFELQSPRVNMQGQPVQPDKQGYLFKKVVKKGKGWKCSWFVLEKGIFMYYKNVKREAPDGGLNLLLCTVKEVPQKHLCFQVISTEDRFSLRATNEAEYSEWLEALRNGIASQLANGGGLEDLTDSKRPSSRGSLAHDLWTIDGNNRCADCRQKDPDWAVLNWGVLICVKCSGIHRSLGVHISKVRSLELDKWEPQQLGLMKSIGNTLSNSLWEADVPEAWIAQRPEPESDGKTKELWIKAKYVEKAFVCKTQFSPHELCQRLWAAVLAKDYASVVESLLLGVDVNWPDPEEKSRTVIHALPSSGGDAALLELLLQNGGEVNLEDDRKRTPLHYSVENDRPDLCKILRARGASLTKDRDGHTPLELAESLELEACAAALRGEKKETSNETKSSITGIGSTVVAGGLPSAAPEDMSKALRGSLNLLSEFSPNPGRRDTVKDRSRAGAVTARPVKPRLISKLKGQVIGRKKAFTVSEPRPVPLSSADRLAQRNKIDTSDEGNDEDDNHGVDNSVSDPESEFCPARRKSPLHSQSLYSPTLQRPPRIYSVDDRLAGRDRAGEGGGSSPGNGPDLSGDEPSKLRLETSPVRGFIPRSRRRKSTDLSPIVLGQARERRGDQQSPGSSPVGGSPPVSLGSSGSTDNYSSTATGGVAKAKEPDAEKKDQQVGVPPTRATPHPAPKRGRSTEWVKPPPPPLDRATASSRSVVIPSVSSAPASPSSSFGSALAPAVNVCPPTASLDLPDGRGRRKSDATSPTDVPRDSRRKKGNRRDEQPSNSLGLLEPPKESMGKKLRSLRHSFGRRDQEQLHKLDKEAWSSSGLPTQAGTWVHGSGSHPEEGERGDAEWEV